MAKKPTLYTTPAGELKYAHITKPNTRFNPDGAYEATLALEGEAAEELRGKLQALAEAAREQLISEVDAKKAKQYGAFELHTGSTDELDEDGDETGRTLFSFKNAAVGKKSNGETFAVSVPVVGANKKPLGADKVVGRGSKAKIAFAAVPFVMPANKLIGVTLRLKAVQVLDLVQYGGSAADVFGEEEGYEADGEDAAADETAGANF